MNGEERGKFLLINTSDFVICVHNALVIKHIMWHQSTLCGRRFLVLEHGILAHDMASKFWYMAARTWHAWYFSSDIHFKMANSLSHVGDSEKVHIESLVTIILADVGMKMV